MPSEGRLAQRSLSPCDDILPKVVKPGGAPMVASKGNGVAIRAQPRCW